MGSLPFSIIYTAAGVFVATADTLFPLSEVECMSREINKDSGLGCLTVRFKSGWHLLIECPLHADLSSLVFPAQADWVSE